MISYQEFSINFEHLEREFNDPDEKERREWFIKLEKSVKDRLQEEWIKDLNLKYRSQIPMLDWFKAYCRLDDISNVYELDQINVQTSLFKRWNLVSGTTITSVHPPMASIKITVPEGEIIATPFKTGKKGTEPPIMEDIRKLHEQNNYSNQILQTIANQVDHINNKIDNKSLMECHLSKTQPKVLVDYCNWYH